MGLGRCARGGGVLRRRRAGSDRAEPARGIGVEAVGDMALGLGERVGRARLRRDLDEVRRYGEHHDIWQLTTPKWEAVETDGWEMTSIAAYILQAKGAYRMPDARLFSFVIFDAVEWAPGAPV